MPLVPPATPPEHVRAAFGVADAEPERVECGGGWLCGDLVLEQATDPHRAAWTAQTLDRLHVDRARLGRHQRSTDGRWMVSGWTAARHLIGRPEPRHDEVVAVSMRLHAATAKLSRPAFLNGDAENGSLYSVGDAAAWGEQEVTLPAEAGGDWFDELSATRRAVDLQPQLVHGDLFGNVLFAGSAAPGVIGFVPYWRPAEWAAAVAVVDALAWGGADPGLLVRWSSLPEWPQALLRALLFRIAVHALHPQSDEQSLAGLRRAVELVREVL